MSYIEFIHKLRKIDVHNEYQNNDGLCYVVDYCAAKVLRLIIRKTRSLKL